MMSREVIRVESSTIHNTYYTHNTHMLFLNHFQIHNTCYTHIFFYVYTCVHNFSKLNYFGAFFQVLRMFFMLSWSFTDSQKLEARFKLIRERFAHRKLSQKNKSEKNIKKFVWNGKLLCWIQKKQSFCLNIFQNTQLWYTSFFICVHNSHTTYTHVIFGFPNT